MDRVKIGMIGSQFAADLHLRNLSKLRGAKLDVIAIASKNKEHAAAFAKKYDIPNFYDDYRRILEIKNISSAKNL
jgi:predicted dehydrogenase